MTLDEMNELISNLQCADLGFVDEYGYPSIRRVFCTYHKGIGEHMFSTNAYSVHVQRLLASSTACLYFADNEKYCAVCLHGTAIVHTQREYKKLLWHDGDEEFYPKGIDDEDYCVIEFAADSGRYYRYGESGDISLEDIDNYDKGRSYIDFRMKFM